MSVKDYEYVSKCERLFKHDICVYFHASFLFHNFACCLKLDDIQKIASDDASSKRAVPVLPQI